MEMKSMDQAVRARLTMRQGPEEDDGALLLGDVVELRHGADASSWVAVRTRT
jgi:hypothetical protein